MSFWFSVSDSQYKLNLEYKIFGFPKNGFCMYTTAIPRLNPTLSAENVHSYPFSQFCYTTNIKIFCYSSGFY